MENEALTQEAPQETQTVEEIKPWHTREERDDIAREAIEAKAGGMLMKDFARSRGMSISVLNVWLAKYRKANKIKATGGNSGVEMSENFEKYQEAKKLVTQGMNISRAEKQVGLYKNGFFTLRRKESGKPYRQSNAGRKPAVRLLKMAERPLATQDFNKPLQAENQALRRLIVDLSLDIQALKDEIGRKA